jgi:hypothetical protein
MIAGHALVAVASTAMNETIRDFVTRRVRGSLWMGIGGWAIAASAMLTGNPTIEPVQTAAGMLMVAGAILNTYGIKCPRCSTRLGQVVMPLAIPGLKPKPNFCPYCGVSFNEQRQPQTGINPIS